MARFSLLLIFTCFLWQCKSDPARTYFPVLKIDENEAVLHLNDSTSIPFVLIPAGSFLMGSSETEADRQKDEGPVVQVEISESFFLGQYEITQAQWLAVMGSNPSIFKDQTNYGDYPVDMISWNDCQAFIDSLNSFGMGRYRMPTEAEWEYSARAGTNTRFHWGDDEGYKEIYQYAWFNPNSMARSMPVGIKEPNQWNLYDMIGNMWEWCSDWKGAYENADSIAYDPGGPEMGEEKIFRGGSWFNPPNVCRTANRNAHEPETGYSNIGLRLVLENKSN